MILLYITNPNKEKAKEIAHHLIEKKLIACANLFPIESVYRWKGKINEESEYVLIAKTIEKNYKKIKEEVKKIHPYEVPCIIKIQADANKEFMDWINYEVE